MVGFGGVMEDTGLNKLETGALVMVGFDGAVEDIKLNVLARGA